MTVEATIKGVQLILDTSEKVFSPQQVDRGTLAMLSQVEFKPDDRVLDLGCGYGVVGILAAKIIGSERIVMVDVDPEAVRMARRNAAQNGVGEVSIMVSDGLEEVDEGEFTLILSNPPYHEDFSVPKGFIEDGFKRLVIGGQMVMVVKRLDWYRNKLSSIFGGVKVQEIDGYYILSAEKRSSAPPAKPKASVSKKHAKRQELASKSKRRRK